MDRGKTRPTKRNYLLHGKLECKCGMDWVGRWYSKYDRPFYMCKNNERRYYRNTPNRKHLHQKNCSKPKRINGKVLDKYKSIIFALNLISAKFPVIPVQ